MSKSATDADLDPTADVESADRSKATDDVESEGDAESEADAPDVEEDLFEEELRIDGICGVY